MSFFLNIKHQKDQPHKLGMKWKQKKVGKEIKLVQEFTFLGLQIDQI